MKFDKSAIEKLDKYVRINLVNQLSGVKGANLIGSVSAEGITNLAIFNSVIHIGASPASIGFLLRPLTVPRHTYSNIMENGFYTINQVNETIIDAAHLTSAKYEAGVSEFKELEFTEEFIDGFKAPYVGESKVKIGVRFEEQHEIALNGTVLIVGVIEEIHINEELMESTGHINLDLAKAVGVAGLDTYYKVHKIGQKKFARVGEK